MIIGSHVSFKKDSGLVGSAKEAVSYNANTFMFYTGAPQNTMRNKIDDTQTRLGIEYMNNNNIDIKNVMVHAPYIINLANNKDEDKYQFSINFLKQEIKRCENLGMKYLILHPGSHVGLGVEKGLDNIVNALNIVLKDAKVIILLETMSGKGTELGANLEEIKYIIDRVEQKKLLGVCLDTCHLNDKGYDIADFDSFLDHFDNLIGINYIKCIHINDSKNPAYSSKDRHENIGFGHLGFENIINIIYHERLKDVPKILETPYIEGNAPYKEEIEMIKQKKFNPNLKELKSV